MKSVYVAFERRLGDTITLVTHSKRKMMSLLKKAYKLDKQDMNELKTYDHIPLLDKNGFFDLHVKEYTPNVSYKEFPHGGGDKIGTQ